jgi:hypothetical protein
MNADECRVATTAHRHSYVVPQRACRIRQKTWLRRALATLLLGLFSFSLLSPVLAADPSPERPSCCLRDGKHHCAMDAAETQSDGPALQSSCPLFSRIRCSMSNPILPALLPPDQAARLAFSSSPLPNTRGFVPKRLAADTERKRGPPSRFA